MAELARCADPAVWDGFVTAAEDGSPLQSWSWGELKARHGWSVERYLLREGDGIRAGASVLRRRLPGGILAVHYAPRGPVIGGDWSTWPQLWPALKKRLAEDGGSVFKVDPESSQDPARFALTSSGARISSHPIQHQATIVVDIRGGDQALMRLKESTRRNIRQGERAGILVEMSDASAAMDHFVDLLEETAARRQFTVRSRAYYRDLLAVFRERGQVQVFLARLGSRVLAGAVMLFFGRTLAYLYGGTAADAAELKPGYLLHWRAVEEGQRRGCERYDMWGVPLDPKPGHRGYGYYTFKSRFNGELRRYIGLYDLPVRPVEAAAVRLAERFVRAGQPEFV